MKFALRKFGKTERWFAWRPVLYWVDRQRKIIWLEWFVREWSQPNFYSSFNHWEYTLESETKCEKENELRS